MHSQQLYMSLNGRISREIYWKKWVLPFLVIGSILNFICYMAGWLDGHIWLVDDYVEMTITMLSFSTIEINNEFIIAQIKFWSLISTLTSGAWLSIIVKRLHDRGHSGWMIFVGLIPILGPMWLTFECGFMKGNEEENDYGLPFYDYY